LNVPDALSTIKRKYIEKFGDEDLDRASLRIISHEDTFIIIKCSLSCYAHLRETLTLLNGRITSLSTSGSLKALRSRMEEIKKRYKGTVINTEVST
jgi:RNase P/RNase MRP subunit POP5